MLVCVCICICACVRVCACECTCMCMYVYVYVHVHVAHIREKGHVSYARVTCDMHTRPVYSCVCVSVCQCLLFKCGCRILRTVCTPPSHLKHPSYVLSLPPLHRTHTCCTLSHQDNRMSRATSSLQNCRCALSSGSSTYRAHLGMCVSACVCLFVRMCVCDFSTETKENTPHCASQCF